MFSGGYFEIDSSPNPFAEVRLVSGGYYEMGSSPDPFADVRLQYVFEGMFEISVEMGEKVFIFENFAKKITFMEVYPCFY